MSAEFVVFGYIREQYEALIQIHVPVALKFLVHTIFGKIRYFPTSKLLSSKEDSELFDLLRSHLQTLSKGDKSDNSMSSFFDYDQYSKDIKLWKSLLQNLKPDIKHHSLKLIYRASDNNFTAKSFHQKCDGRGATVIIIKNNFGNIFCLFTSIPWSSDHKTHIDNASGSFLIRSRHKDIQQSCPKAVGDEACFNYLNEFMFQ